MQSMEKKKETVIWCSNCRKDIKVHSYRVHMWFCCNTDKINPVLQNMFKSQLHMSMKLHDLIRHQQNKEGNQEQTFPCVHCGYPMTLVDFDIHPARCPCLPVECPHCSIEFPKDLMEQHQACCEQKQNAAKHPLVKARPALVPTPKSADEPTAEQHIQFLMRELAHSLGVMKSRALTNRELVDLHKSCYRRNNQAEECDVCPICDIDFEQGQNLVKLPCKHLFHRRCICGWFSVANTCPMCRYEMERKK